MAIILRVVKARLSLAPTMTTSVPILGTNNSNINSTSHQKNISTGTHHLLLSVVKKQRSRGRHRPKAAVKWWGTP